jgi:hypothetical protein
LAGGGLANVRAHQSPSTSRHPFFYDSSPNRLTSSGASLEGRSAVRRRYCSDPCPVAVTLEMTVLNLPAAAPFRFLLSHIVQPITEIDAAAAPGSRGHARQRPDIANHLLIAPLTARNHVQNIRKRSKCTRRAKQWRSVWRGLQSAPLAFSIYEPWTFPPFSAPPPGARTEVRATREHAEVVSARVGD